MQQLSPYFKMLAREKRICPKCKRRPTRIVPSLHPDFAYEECDCGYSRTLEAPPSFQAKPRGRVIHVDFGKR